MSIGPPSELRDGRCGGCGYDTEVTKRRTEWGEDGKDVWLCDFCQGALWNGVFRKDPSIAMICFAGNVIRDSIRNVLIHGR